MELVLNILENNFFRTPVSYKFFLGDTQGKLWSSTFEKAPGRPVGYAVVDDSYPFARAESIGHPTCGVVHPLAPYVALAAQQETPARQGWEKGKEEKGNVLSIWTPL